MPGSPVQPHTQTIEQRFITTSEMDKGRNFKHNPLGTRFFVFDNNTFRVVVKNKEPNCAP